MRKLWLSLMIIVGAALLVWSLRPAPDGPFDGGVFDGDVFEQGTTTGGSSSGDAAASDDDPLAADGPAEDGRVDERSSAGRRGMPPGPARTGRDGLDRWSRRPDARVGVRGNGVVVPYDLQADEARGGHTIARHVGRTDDQLRERLARESISAASTYTDLETAERVVGLAIRRQHALVEEWQGREGPGPNLVLRVAAPTQSPIGRVLRRSGGEAIEVRAAVVVLRRTEHGFIVLTSYPEEPRGTRRFQ